MKLNKLSVAIAALVFVGASSSAMADHRWPSEANYGQQEPARESTKTRAEVIAELKRASAQGWRVGASPFYPEATADTSAAGRVATEAGVANARSTGFGATDNMYSGD